LSQTLSQQALSKVFSLSYKKYEKQIGVGYKSDFVLFFLPVDISLFVV